MSITVTCPSGHKINAPEKFAAKVVKCPKCSQPIQIPSLAEEVPMALEMPTPAADPFADFSANASGAPADPFGEFATIPAASYAPTSYSPGNYSPGAYAPSGGGYAPVSQGSGQPATAGNKSAQSKKSVLPLVLIGVVGGGLVLVVLAVAVVGFMYMKSGPSGSNTIVASLGLESEVDREFELIKAGLNAKFWPNQQKLSREDEEDRERAFETIRKLLSPDAIVYFGYDTSMRKRMREYFLTQQLSEEEAAMAGVQVVGRLKKMAEELELKPDQNNRVSFPQPEEEFRKQIMELNILDNSFGVDEIQFKSLVQGLKDGTLTLDQQELALYAKLAVINRW